MFCYVFVVGGGVENTIRSFEHTNQLALLHYRKSERKKCFLACLFVDRFRSVGMWIATELPIPVRDTEQLS